jgi:hypothetical protein
MRSFRSTTLVVAAALGVVMALFIEPPAFAESVQRAPLATADGDAIYRSVDDANGPAPSATSDDGVCPEHATEADETARARAYLIETATPGYTMTRQGPELAIGRLHPEFVRRLAAAVSEARAAGLPSAGIFSAYRPPAFGVGGFVDKFHSLHTYGLAVDVIGIGAPGSPNALLWHEIAARHGVICPYGPYNLVEWNHCQPTWVKIILPDNPLRETVTADGPINLEDMFETAYALLATSGAAGVSVADPPAHFFKPPDVRTAVAVAPGAKAVNRRMASTKTALASALSATRWPPLPAGRAGWPKGVPRIAQLDEETRKPGSRAGNRSHPSVISIPPILGESSVGRGAIPTSAHKNGERPRLARSNT